MDHPVARRPRGDLEPIEDRDARGQQRAQRPGEPRDRGLAEQVADDRHTQQQTIERQPSRRGLVVHSNAPDRRRDQPQDQPPVGLEHVGHPDHQSGGTGQGQVDAGEHLFEGRDHEDEQHGDGDHRDSEDHRRVDHRALHLAYQRLVLL